MNDFIEELRALERARIEVGTIASQKRVQVRIPADLADLVRRIAKLTGSKSSEVFALAIKEFSNQFDPKQIYNKN